MTIDNRRELNRSEKTELQLQWLFSDLLAQARIDEILEWREALGFKLPALRHLQGRLVEIAKKAPSVVREEMEQPDVLLGPTSTVIENARLYLEFFFYLGTGVFDVLAKLTKRFYPRNEKSFARDGRLYFTDIMRVLMATAIDKEFAKVLSAHAEWITSIYNNRNTLAHSASPFIGFDKNYNMVFEKRRPDQTQLWRKHENADLVEYLEETLSNLYDFLEHYRSHFREFVAETETTRWKREALEQGRFLTTSS